MIRTIIIDDELPAIKVLAFLLKKKCKEDIELVATTQSPYEGKALIEEHKPELVFMDIEMPGITGIDLVRSFKNPPFRVVFVTAFDAYALEAFRLSALDYLLKPFDPEDIVNVVEKIKIEKRKNNNLAEIQFQNLEKHLYQYYPGDPKIGISMSDRISFISISDLLYCEAHGSYTIVYLQDGKKITASKSLGDFETQLRGHHFLRIHHSVLINLGRVKEFQRLDGGFVVMENNTRLEVSQRKRKDFLNAIDDLIV